MANLNVMKMVGLMVLLAIALTLPSVLPEVNTAPDGHVQRPHDELQQAVTS